MTTGVFRMGKNTWLPPSAAAVHALALEQATERKPRVKRRRQARALRRRMAAAQALAQQEPATLPRPQHEQPA